MAIDWLAGVVSDGAKEVNRADIRNQQRNAERTIRNKANSEVKKANEKIQFFAAIFFASLIVSITSYFFAPIALVSLGSAALKAVLEVTSIISGLASFIFAFLTIAEVATGGIIAVAREVQLKNISDSADREIARGNRSIDNFFGTNRSSSRYESRYDYY